MSGSYRIVFIDAHCQKEYLGLSSNAKVLVDKGLARLRLRADEIGKPLGGALTGCKELKFRSCGIRLIFRIVKDEIQIVEIVAIGSRDKEKVFKTATNRVQ